MNSREVYKFLPTVSGEGWVYRCSCGGEESRGRGPSIEGKKSTESLLYRKSEKGFVLQGGPYEVQEELTPGLVTSCQSVVPVVERPLFVLQDVGGSKES